MHLSLIITYGQQNNYICKDEWITSRAPNWDMYRQLGLG